MNKFSEAVDAARSAMETGDFAEKFKELKPDLMRLLGPDGPVGSQAALLDTVRSIMQSEKKAGVASPDLADARVIIAGAGVPLNKPNRAATLKMLRHLYLERSAGGQSIWVYSPPVAYSKWIFDEVAGATDTTLETVLAKPGAEVYSGEQRGIMATAVQTARSVAMAVAVKLGAASDATKAVARRYFGNSDTSEKQIVEIMTTLASGYLKIANACNGSSIVISDEPVDRSGGGWKDWAFIYTAEKMSIIYLQGAWLKKADEVSPSNQSPLYRCVRTIIHELSHKKVSTEDVVYGPKGLKPEGSAALTPEYALHNADSWAYFAVDLVGQLTGPDKRNGDTPTKAILRAPARALTAV